MASAVQVDLPRPEGSVAFGTLVKVLPNGNMVVTDPEHPEGGAAYLFSPDGQMISRVTGVMGPPGQDYSVVSRFGLKVTVLTNGNYVIWYPDWSTETEARVGMAAWASGTQGLSGKISAANALVGRRAEDHVAVSGVTPLANGHYVVGSPDWSNNGLDRAGAATWADGTKGITGYVSPANSLVGDRAGDHVAWSTIPLRNGNYVLSHSGWSPEGLKLPAFTWADGTRGLTGAVSLANSLMVPTPDDALANYVTPLPNGNYVLGLPFLDDGDKPDLGVVILADGTRPLTGMATIDMGLHGTEPYSHVGYPASEPLASGHVVVISASWNGPLGPEQGAVTWMDGRSGRKEAVSQYNSLVGSGPFQYLGDDPVYVVKGVTALANGHYVVASPRWDDASGEELGAVTWGDGFRGSTGLVTRENSIVGQTAGDLLGLHSWHAVLPLRNGNYVITSPRWQVSPGQQRGAVTWAEGGRRTVGEVGVHNSLVGASSGDNNLSLEALTNGHYVVGSVGWIRDGILGAGALTWADGTRERTGTYSIDNSLVGSRVRDSTIGATALADGNYVGCTHAWDNGEQRDAGAVSWGSGLGGLVGEISPANSLVGTQRADNLCIRGVQPLPDGRYVIHHDNWNNGNIPEAEAITLGQGRLTGLVNSTNSVLGTVPFGGSQGGEDGLFYDYDVARSRLMVGKPAENRVTLMTLDEGPPPAVLRIRDTWMQEGNAGNKDMAFTVELSRPLEAPVYFDFSAMDGSARAGEDFVATVGRLHIAPGETSVKARVAVVGDRHSEPDETFVARISNASQAGIDRGEAKGTLFDDDGPAQTWVSLQDAAFTEGDGGRRTVALTLAVHPVSESAIQFDLASRDGSATAGSDYLPIGLSDQVIPAGRRLHTVALEILGDTVAEPDETLHLRLDDVRGAAIGVREAIVTLMREDGAVDPPVPARTANDRYLWRLPAASEPERQGFVRLSNLGQAAAQVEVWGIDALGRRSPGVIQLDLGVGQSRQFNSQDMEAGNATKGLRGALGKGVGAWTVVVRSAGDIEALAYVRTPDGFLTSLHDWARWQANHWQVPIFNPAENRNQVSLLRLVNPGATEVDVSVRGWDDAGRPGEATLSLRLPAHAAVELESADLEAGNAAKGLAGRLGDGQGKWRLAVEASGELAVQSLLADPLGKLTNLSTLPRPEGTGPGVSTLWLVRGSEASGQEAFIRLSNRSQSVATITLRGTDEQGRAAPGTVSLSLAAGESRQFTARDLEQGNAAKGLAGALGQGAGDWRLAVESTADIVPLSLIRTPDGFLTTIHETVAGPALAQRVPIFNPAENVNQVSLLRLVNPGPDTARITIRGTDDSGRPGSGEVRLELAPGASRSITALELESGQAGPGLEGALGDGEGKWALELSASVPVVAMSLLADPKGYLTNLSTSTRDGDSQR